ncbi:MAG TPA: hypothetical protein VM529_19155, partial [Gemmata sp.]|nr:hypothetical protein [Gemmata sp.]
VSALTTGAVVIVAAHLGLAAAAEASFAVRDPVYADREAALARVERDLPPGAPLVVMLGTSRTGNGFDARRAGERLTATLGRRADAFNFGLPAAGPVLHRVYLERLIAAGHRPALLLVEVLPPSVAVLTDGPLEAKFLDGGRFTRDEVELLAGYGMPRDSLARQRRETLVAPWYALRFPLLGRVAPAAIPAGRRHDEGRNCDARGWYRIWEEALPPRAISEAKARARRDYADILRDLTPGGAAARALGDTLTLAREHAIPTRLVLMPEATEFRAMYSPGATRRLDHWVRQLARDAGCPVVDARDWVPDAGFVDGHHLLPGGSATFSDRLTDEVLAPGVAP